MKNIIYRDKEIKFPTVIPSLTAWEWQPRLRQWIHTVWVNQQFTTANYNEDRDFDASSTTLWEVADVLSTLIEDLKLINLLK